MKEVEAIFIPYGVLDMDMIISQDDLPYLVIPTETTGTNKTFIQMYGRFENRIVLTEDEYKELSRLNTNL